MDIFHSFLQHIVKTIFLSKVLKSNLLSTVKGFNYLRFFPFIPLNLFIEVF